MGVPETEGLPLDTDRALGVQQVVADEFNCMSVYSDAEPADCAELRFVKTKGEEQIRAFRPPMLRNATLTAPYMHAGQFATIEEVLAHYNAAPSAPAGHSELEPLNLTATEVAQLLDFLHTLEGPLATNPTWLQDRAP